MKSLLLVLVCVFACRFTCLGNQRGRIPRVPEGAQVWSGDATVVLEVFYDLACLDSATSHKTLMSIAPLLNKKIDFKIHLFPLPYHYNSYVMNQGGKIFHDFYPKINFNLFVDGVFSFQEDFFNPNTSDLTVPEVKDKFSHAVTSVIPHVDQEAFREALDSLDYANDLRTSWEYGVMRTVAGTPTFMLNGVIIEGAEQFDTDDWISFLGAYTSFSKPGDEDSSLDTFEFQDRFVDFVLFPPSP